MMMVILGVLSIILANIFLQVADNLYWRYSGELLKSPAKRSWWQYGLCYFSMAGFILLAVIGSHSYTELMVNGITVLLLWLMMVTDFEQQLIFDEASGGLAVWLIAMAVFSPLSIGDMAGGAVIGGGCILVLILLTRGAIGGGDLKLMAVVGLWLGIDGVIAALLWGFCLGGAAALAMLLMRFKGRKDTFAYGPYFIFGSFVSFLLNFVK